MAKKVGLDKLAEELGQEPISFYMKIKELGFDYDTPFSMIAEKDFEKIRAKIQGDEDSNSAKPKPVVIRRRAKVVEPPVIEETPPVVLEEAPVAIVEEKPIVVAEKSEEKAVEAEPSKAEVVVDEKTQEEERRKAAKKSKKKGKKPKVDDVIEIPELEAFPVAEETEESDEKSEAAKKGRKKDKGKSFESVKPPKKRSKEEDIVYEERYVPKRGKAFRPFGKQPKKKASLKKFKQTEITTPRAIKKVIKIEESIVVGDLSQRMGIKSSEVIKKLFALGIMTSINQAVDVDTASLIATEFGYEVEKVSLTLEDVLKQVEDKPEDLKFRPPVVTIMGHVDHGKTSLLDAIRQTNVTAGEAGGITQHIGAYEVVVHDKEVVFLDTPGHEAFTAMRARGAKVTDIVVLVVAADDGVMPQTVEAINHAKAAEVPIIVAVNKIDKSNANPQRVKQDLMNYKLVSEEWGGDTIFAEVSAKQKLGITELLEMILLQAEMLEIKANPNKAAIGVVIESKLDKGLGPVATVLVQEGTLHVGDQFITGSIFGKVRALINDRGKRVHSAGPSIPVEVLGLPDTPSAGDEFHVISDEKKAKIIIAQRQAQQRERELAKSSKVTLEELYQKIQDGKIQDLNLVLKADVGGSCQAVREALLKLSLQDIRIRVIHESVGGITESDVMLASASNAIIIGFNVRPEPKAATLASKEQVDMRLYTIIYDLLNDIEKAVKGMLAPVKREAILGHAEVREVFSVPKIGKVAGTFITDGKVTRNSFIRVLRDNVVIYNGQIASLKRFKDDAKEVVSGYECGIGIVNFNDIKVGDVFESYIIEEVKQDAAM